MQYFRFLPDPAKLRKEARWSGVSSGVGWLTIEAAQSWPTLHVVGVDSWPPALDLARKKT
jgi:hypothetical protein